MELQPEAEALKFKLRDNDLSLGMITNHQWPFRRRKIRMKVKVIVDECGMAPWKPQALRKFLGLSRF